MNNKPNGNGNGNGNGKIDPDTLAWCLNHGIDNLTKYQYLPFDICEFYGGNATGGVAATNLNAALELIDKHGIEAVRKLMIRVQESQRKQRERERLAETKTYEDESVPTRFLCIKCRNYEVSDPFFLCGICRRERDDGKVDDAWIKDLALRRRVLSERIETEAREEPNKPVNLAYLSYFRRWVNSQKPPPDPYSPYQLPEPDDDDV